MRVAPRLTLQAPRLLLATFDLTTGSGSRLSLTRGLRILPSAASIAFPRRFSTGDILLRHREPNGATKFHGLDPAEARPVHHQPLRSSVSGLFVVLTGVLALSVYYAFHPQHPEEPRPEDLSDTLYEMTADTAPGRPGNLTPEQEEKLRRLWQLIFQVCAVGQDQNGAAAATPATTEPSSAAASEKAQDDDAKSAKNSSRMSFFSRKPKKEAEASKPATPAPAGASVVLNLKDGEADKYGQTKHFYETLASQSPESIRDTIWSMVKHDHPDALILRFLRARKWDAERALIMLVSTMNWRAQQMKVDDDIMRNGEGAALAAEGNAGDAAAQKLGHDFMTQIRKGISYVHGHDKEGRPLCFVNVRLHRQGEQAEEALERYTVYLIETCRMLLQPPVDTAVSFPYSSHTAQQQTNSHRPSSLI